VKLLRLDSLVFSLQSSGHPNWKLLDENSSSVRRENKPQKVKKCSAFSKVATAASFGLNAMKDKIGYQIPILASLKGGLQR
jgi:hypothetical protein